MLPTNTGGGTTTGVVSESDVVQEIDVIAYKAIAARDNNFNFIF